MLGGDYVFSWKPSPNPLATGRFDEDETRKSIRNALDIAKRNGCHVEMIMKDTHTFGGKPDNVVIWSRIARQESERW
jgi:2'-5' RNA ligase